MKRYFHNSRDAVEFVDGLLQSSGPASPLTMTITREPSVGYYVHTATTELSADTEKNLAAWPYLETQPNT